ncbi:hypothetical protein ACJZ2D_006414 [Fusarium nematophilum]
MLGYTNVTPSSVDGSPANNEDPAPAQEPPPGRSPLIRGQPRTFPCLACLEKMISYGPSYLCYSQSSPQFVACFPCREKKCRCSNEMPAVARHYACRLQDAAHRRLRGQRVGDWNRLAKKAEAALRQRPPPSLACDSSLRSDSPMVRPPSISSLLTSPTREQNSPALPQSPFPTAQSPLPSEISFMTSSPPRPPSHVSPVRSSSRLSDLLVVNNRLLARSNDRKITLTQRLDTLIDHHVAMNENLSSLIESISCALVDLAELKSRDRARVKEKRRGSKPDSSDPALLSSPP